MHFASTLPKPHEPTRKPKLCQRACKAKARQKEILKCPTARQKTMNITATNRPTNHGRQGSTGGNNVYVAIAGAVVSRRSALLGNFVLNGQVSASNPLPHIHANR